MRRRFSCFFAYFQNFRYVNVLYLPFPIGHLLVTGNFKIKIAINVKLWKSRWCWCWLMRLGMEGLFVAIEKLLTPIMRHCFYWPPPQMSFAVESHDRQAIKNATVGLARQYFWCTNNPSDCGNREFFWLYGPSYWMRWMANRPFSDSMNNGRCRFCQSRAATGAENWYCYLGWSLHRFSSNMPFTKVMTYSLSPMLWWYPREAYDTIRGYMPVPSRTWQQVYQNYNGLTQRTSW